MKRSKRTLMFETFKAIVGLGILLPCIGSVLSADGQDPDLLPDFSYNSDDIHGPPHWGDQCQNAGKQSPIDIRFNESTHDSRIRKLLFTNYNSKSSNLSIVETNNGYNVMIYVHGHPIPTVSGGGLLRPYHLVQFHFHWGPNDSYGSEHTFNDGSFPLEVHFVHTAIGNDVPEHEKVAVMSIMLHLSVKRNPLLDPIVNNLHEIRHAGEAAALRDVMLSNLLPTRHDRFFRYAGSLTAPPCSEQVIWTVFYDTLPISSDQLAQFRQLLDPHGHAVKLNSRRPQDVGNRKVSASFPASLFML